MAKVELVEHPLTDEFWPSLEIKQEGYPGITLREQEGQLLLDCLDDTVKGDTNYFYRTYGVQKDRRSCKIIKYRSKGEDLTLVHFDSEKDVKSFRDLFISNYSHFL